LEKPQSLWHGLRLHPYGTEEEKAAQKDEVRAFAYEEQVFNEPYEQFYEILINGNAPNEKVKGKSGGAGAGKKKGGANGAGAGGGAGGGNWGDRTASVPARSSPKQPYSRDTEMAEIKRLKLAQIKVEEQTKELKKELAAREAKLAALKA
jgi:YEATS domain-containing protein 4